MIPITTFLKAATKFFAMQGIARPSLTKCLKTNGRLFMEGMVDLCFLVWVKVERIVINLNISLFWKKGKLLFTTLKSIPANCLCSGLQGGQMVDQLTHCEGILHKSTSATAYLVNSNTTSIPK
jgi:hypothetical protein